MAELIEMRPQRVHRLRALLDELLARPERDGAVPLVGRFRFDEPHGQTQRRLDDRLRIGSIVPA
jgi:hypothetical protein